jgi:hypothetical protein
VGTLQAAQPNIIGELTTCIRPGRTNKHPELAVCMQLGPCESLGGGQLLPCLSFSRLPSILSGLPFSLHDQQATKRSLPELTSLFRPSVFANQPSTPLVKKVFNGLASSTFHRFAAFCFYYLPPWPPNHHE